MARTDVAACAAGIHSSIRQGQSNNPIFVSAGVWYRIFYSAVEIDLFWQKTTNYGLTWSQPVSMKASTIGAAAVWFDKWTPGDTGTVIHVAYMEASGNNDVLYRALDTATDTLGSEIIAFAGTSGVSNAGCLSLCKSRGNRILIGFDLDGGTELGFTKSDDFPVTAFTAKTDFQEATSDWFLLFPGNYADANDIDCVFWDRSADEISLKTFDDSANNWTGVSAETSIATSMTDVITTTAGPQFSGTIRTSDGHLILAAWTNIDTANADLRLWDINGAASITEKTNVVLNSTDDQSLCGVGIDSADNTLYCFYAGKSDGTETAHTALNVYYKTSSDGGTNWGAETLLTQRAYPITYLAVSPRFASGEFIAMWAGTEVGTAFSQYTSALPPAGASSVPVPTGNMRGGFVN